MLESGSWCRVLQLLKSNKKFAIVCSSEKWPNPNSRDDFKSTKLFADRLTMDAFGGVLWYPEFLLVW